MSGDQVILFFLLGSVFAMLVWGRIRYDLVAFGALVVAVIAGVVPTTAAFSGFGHPATVIVALVLVVSRGLFNSGAVELIARRVVTASRGLGAHIAIMSGVGAALSAVMNNVAALALLMPVDIEAAAKAKRSPALTLMPLSFATILGGMVTLIGTPPNIVIATFRESALGATYRMFDFAPVGAVVAVVGVAYVALLGWRLLPADRGKHDARQEMQVLEGYVAEARVREKSPAVDQVLRELHPLADEYDVGILGLVRNGRRLPGAAANVQVRVGDFIVLEGAVKAMDKFIGAAGLVHAGSERHGEWRGESLTVAEVVVPEGARIEGRSAMSVRLAYRQGVTILGVSRQGQAFRDRVRRLPIAAGDILLLYGPEERMADVIDWLGCLPLAKRGLQVVQRSKAWLAIGTFALAVLLASVGILYLPVALALVAALYVALGVMPLSQLYDSIEWPVIVLLGSLIPIGAALEASGGTALIAQSIVGATAGLSPVFVLAILMIVTMTLSDVLNNVATALIAAPIAIDIATRLGVNPDPFLMAVALAASSAFLTPIGHKNNTIIMGPGGYHFGDYWRMGLVLEVLVLVVGIPMIVTIWPL